MGSSQSVSIIVVLVAVAIATITDLRTFKIHNVLTAPLLLSGLIYHGITGGTHGLIDSALGCLVGFGALLFFYLLGGMGGGDVKLMAGVGAWLGLPLTLFVLAVASLSAGLYACVLIVVTRRYREVWVNLQIIWHRVSAAGRYLGADDPVEAEVARPDRRQRVIPFGAMVCIGVVAVVILVRWRTMF